ncbi:immunity protein Imm33 domain-containing protein, partial [Tumebacillus flagellatus]|uniref:immunity protein Imm33 domain-containing protein n=1 Tax=Tumebacillus flagellatus TaxID=1157490 RepID=UPI003B75C286
MKLVAPNYETNPFTEVTDDLTLSLSVQLAQNHVLTKLSVDGETSLFQDKIIAAKGAIDLERVYLERSTHQTEGDSGWYLGPVDNS